MVVATLLIQIVAAAYVYGKLTQQVGENAARTREHGIQLEVQRGRIDNHDVQIGELKAWNAGYEASRAIHKADNHGQ